LFFPNNAIAKAEDKIHESTMNVVSILASKLGERVESCVEMQDCRDKWCIFVPKSFMSMYGVID